MLMIHKVRNTVAFYVAEGSDQRKVAQPTNPHLAPLFRGRRVSGFESSMSAERFFFLKK